MRNGRPPGSIDIFGTRDEVWSEKIGLEFNIKFLFILHSFMGGGAGRVILITDNILM